ncbi:MAG: hypothetical protein Q8P81_04260 [Nanoarchaeota archaeon]|nr:hypothetical protein [Nanoarchaeota archaeon]
MEEETRRESEEPSGNWNYVFGSAMKYAGLFFLVCAPVKSESLFGSGEVLDVLARGSYYLLGGFLYVGGEMRQRGADFEARRDFSRSAGESELEVEVEGDTLYESRGGRE